MQRILFSLILSIELFASEYNFAPMVFSEGEEKPIVVCVASYKNEKYFKRNLDSIFSQKYHNFRVIYVDDASPDRTFECVSNYVKANGVEDRITVIENEVNCGAMANLYKMIHSCDDEEIIVTLDGDDWFAHPGVLRRVNQAYLDRDVWVTYGNFKYFPGSKNAYVRAVFKKDLEEGKCRDFEFMFTHLRTFYAKLFKEIPVDRFKDQQGLFFSMGWDVAIMISLADLAGSHMYFIPEVLYIYNVETPINDHKRNKKKQIELGNLMMSRRPLKRLEGWDAQ